MKLRTHKKYKYSNVSTVQMNLRPLSAALATLLLAACGSDSNNTPVATKPTYTSSITGTASKGIISNGVVTAYELDAAGNVIRTLASVTTDANGHYSLPLPAEYDGGVVKVQITANADTRMKCDALDSCNGTAFGKEITLDSLFTLDALVIPTGTSMEMSVTPLTHMAAARAMALGGTSAENVAAANSEVGALVGFNIITTPVKDVTQKDLSGASGEGVKYGLFNAAFASLFFNTANQSNDLNDGLSKLANTFSDGKFDSQDDFRIAVVLQALNDVKNYYQDTYARTPALVNALSSLDLQIEHIKQQVDAGELDPGIAGGFRTGRIGQAKSLISLTAPLYPEALALDISRKQALKPFRDQQALVQEVLDDETLLATQLLGEVVNQALKTVSTSVDLVADQAAQLSNKPLNIPLSGLSYTVTKKTTVVEGDTSVEKEIQVTENEIISATLYYPAGGNGLRLELTGSTHEQQGDFNLTITSDALISDKTRILDAFSVAGANPSLNGYLQIGGTNIVLANAPLTLALTPAGELNSLSVRGNTQINKDNSHFSGNTDMALKANSSTQADMRLSGYKASGLFNNAAFSLTTDVTWNSDMLLDIDTYGILMRYKNYAGKFSADDIDDSIFTQYSKNNASENIVAKRSVAGLDAAHKEIFTSEVFTQLKTASRNFTETVNTTPFITFSGLNLTAVESTQATTSTSEFNVNFSQLSGTDNFTFYYTKFGDKYTYRADVSGIAGLTSKELGDRRWTGTLQQDIDGNGVMDTINLTMYNATSGVLEISGSGKSVLPFSLSHETQLLEATFTPAKDDQGQRILNYTLKYLIPSTDLSNCLRNPTTFNYIGYYRFFVSDARKATTTTCYDLLTVKTLLSQTANLLKPESETKLVSALISDSQSYENKRVLYHYDTRFNIFDLNAVVSFASINADKINEKYILSNQSFAPMTDTRFTLLTRKDEVAGPLFEVLGSRNGTQFKLEELTVSSDNGPVHKVIVSNADDVKLEFELTQAGNITNYGGSILAGGVNVGRISQTADGKLEFIFRDESTVTN
ncbi:MAG: hypothetical protein H6999_07075 [Hahellaceae bacterium]|nr:hypothetical protein [Hahellaceae bacterium]